MMAVTAEAKPLPAAAPASAPFAVPAGCTDIAVLIRAVFKMDDEQHHLSIRCAFAAPYVFIFRLSLLLRVRLSSECFTLCFPFPVDEMDEWWPEFIMVLCAASTHKILQHELYGTIGRKGWLRAGGNRFVHYEGERQSALAVDRKAAVLKILDALQVQTGAPKPPLLSL